MTRILVYGDSLSWGFDPQSGGRFPLDQVWPDVMAAELDPDVTVIVEALPGRTTVFDSPYAPGRSGSQLLGPLLESHAPLDLVIIMLGTNDLQEPLGLGARHAASGMWTLIDIVVRSMAGPGPSAPQVLVVSPPQVKDPRGFMGVFYQNREAESRELAGHFETIAQRAGVGFFDAATVVTPSAADGVHLDQAGNAVLGRAVAVTVADLLQH